MLLILYMEGNSKMQSINVCLSHAASWLGLQMQKKFMFIPLSLKIFFGGTLIVLENVKNLIFGKIKALIYLTLSVCKHIHD